jgi:hypothetical protein
VPRFPVGSTPRSGSLEGSCCRHTSVDGEFPDRALEFR